MGWPATGCAFGGKTVKVAAPAAANFVGRIGSPALIGTRTIFPITSSARPIAAGGARAAGDLWILRSAAGRVVRVVVACAATSPAGVPPPGGASAFGPDVHRD